MKNLKSILGLALLVSFFFTSCSKDDLIQDTPIAVQEEATEETIDDINLTQVMEETGVKEGWGELTPAHPNYDKIIEQLDGSRGQRCGWRGGESIECNGGTCTVMVVFQSAPISELGSGVGSDGSLACIVCNGGFNDGDVVCQ